MSIFTNSSVDELEKIRIKMAGIDVWLEGINVSLQKITKILENSSLNPKIPGSANKEGGGSE